MFFFLKFIAALNLRRYHILLGYLTTQDMPLMSQQIPNIKRDRNIHDKNNIFSRPYTTRSSQQVKGWCFFGSDSIFLRCMSHALLLFSQLQMSSARNLPEGNQSFCFNSLKFLNWSKQKKLFSFTSWSVFLLDSNVVYLRNGKSM